MCIGGYGHRRIGTSAPVRGGVQNEAPVLKDRENGIDHRGVPSSLSGSPLSLSMVSLARSRSHVHVVIRSCVCN